jgi:hypothetical protein
MRRSGGHALSFLLVFSMAAGCRPKADTRADASSSAVAQGAAADAGAPSPGAPGSFTAEVAGVDAKEGRIVLRNASASGGGASGRWKSIPVAESARPLLSSLKPGDQVVVACQPASGQTTAAGGAASGAGQAAPGVPTDSGSGTGTAAARPRDIGPAGGNDGVGPIALDSDALRTCGAVASLVPVASSAGR